VATGLNTELSEALMVLLMEVCYFICLKLWRFMPIASQSIDHESWHMLPDVRQKARKFLFKMSIASGVLPEKLQISVTRISPMPRGTSAELWRGRQIGGRKVPRISWRCVKSFEIPSGRSYFELTFAYTHHLPVY
jgi:hypothetical protein